MKLPEFITYCTLKDTIVLHERIDNEWHANACNKQRLVIENDDHYATITYTQFGGKCNVLYSELKRVHAAYDKTILDADLDHIMGKFA